MTDKLVLGSYGFGNIGDRAILYSVLDGIDTDYTVSCYRSDLLDIDGRKRNYLDPRILLDAFRADEIIIGGEPVLDSNINGHLNLLSYFLMTVMVFGKITGSKIRLESVGFYNPGLWNSLFLKLVRPESSVRDGLSRDNLGDLGLEPELKKDPALKNTEPVKTVENPDKVLMNVRYLDNDLDQITDREIPRLLELLAPREISGFSTQPIHYNIGITIDREKHSDIETMDNLGIETEVDETIQGLEDQVSEADLLIAYRLHSIIFAMNQKTPVIAIAYHPKVNALCDRYGIPCIDLEDLTAEKIVDTLEDMINRETENS
ncbi:MAG: polysaccharide pyruvyl transferase family protein [Candidatus Nanohaloarchaea archaeon]